MKIKELVEKLKQFDENMEVVIYEIDTFYKPINHIETVRKDGEVGMDGDYYDCMSIDLDDEDDIEFLNEDDVLYISLS